MLDPLQKVACQMIECLRTVQGVLPNGPQEANIQMHEKPAFVCYRMCPYNTTVRRHQIGIQGSLLTLNKRLTFISSWPCASVAPVLRHLRHLIYIMVAKQCFAKQCFATII